ncbi:hypothetical protein HY311_00525 [Candidatus Nomurabacteria bacterium]|nr:hypothetical protein [Candidatus Nomurabacteria bacterium]
MITLERKEQLMTVVASATRKVVDEAVIELSANGVLHGDNFQRVLTQGDKIAAVVKATVKTILAELAENVVGRLKRLFADRTIELAETDGKETLAEANDVFNAGIYGAAKRGVCKATKKTVLAVYYMIKDGTYAQVFGGFGENLKRLCWQESQIVAFCRDPRNREYLRAEGYGTFFLFEGENGGFFVAGVSVCGDGRLDLGVDPLEFSNVWGARCAHRVVVPQL